jgi:hypothetical protein
VAICLLPPAALRLPQVRGSRAYPHTPCREGASYPFLVHLKLHRIRIWSALVRNLLFACKPGPQLVQFLGKKGIEFEFADVATNLCDYAGSVRSELADKRIGCE